MILDKKVLALITARGGSRGVPRKNLRALAEKPLIAWTIEAALGSRFCDRVVLSSEDEEIISVAKSFGCDVPFVRPKNLAADDSSSVDVATHCIESLRESYDYLVLLQPTSPMRTSADIDEALQYCLSNSASSCASVSDACKHPAWCFYLDQSSRLVPAMPRDEFASNRQQLKAAYALNGALYIVETKWFMREQKFISDDTFGYLMPKDRSIDIDDEFDFWIAQQLMQGARDLRS